MRRSDQLIHNQVRMSYFDQVMTDSKITGDVSLTANFRSVKDFEWSDRSVISLTTLEIWRVYFWRVVTSASERRQRLEVFSTLVIIVRS